MCWAYRADGLSQKSIYQSLDSQNSLMAVLFKYEITQRNTGVFGQDSVMSSIVYVTEAIHSQCET